MRLLALCIVILFIIPVVHAQEITKIHIEKKQPLPKVEGALMAGFSSVDITPPPTLPSGARSLTGKKHMKGFRTRLKCRTFCIRDAKGTSVALVQMDLAFGSLIMHHEIASRIAEETDIPLANIVLTSTHTHSGPTGFLSNNFFNTNAGAADGFEPTLYEFLTSRITQSILNAHKNMKPARLATGMIEINGYTRNRAIVPYANNKGNETLDPTDPELVFKAINPWMYMIRLDVESDGKYLPIGAFSTFSIHGTGVGTSVDVFNGDVFAYAQRDLEWQIQQQYQTPWEPIHAFSNGTEGDIAPNMPYYRKDGAKEKKVIPLDWLAARKIGQGIGAKAWELFEELGDQLESDIRIKVAARELDILEHNEVDGIAISQHPCTGACTMSGAYENRSALAPFIRDGSRKTRRKQPSKRPQLEGQGVKKLFFGRLYKKAFPTQSFPSRVMFQLVQIDDMLLVPLPWEVTITAGERMTQAIKNAYKDAGQPIPQYISISSVANDYMCYATTPEEYAIQHYEGSQTIYGNNTVPYITSHLNHLASDLCNQGILSEFPDEWNVELKTKHRYPKGQTQLGQREILQLPKYVAEKKNGLVTKESYWSVKWTDKLPSEIALDQPLVIMEKSTDGKEWIPFNVSIQPMDDEGYDIEVRMESKNKKFATYKAKWYNPEMETSQFYRFRILPRDEKQEVLYSPPFHTPEMK